MTTNDTRTTRYTAVQKAAIAVGPVFLLHFVLAVGMIALGVLLARRAVAATPETAVPYPTR
jgi:hypothetical protein